MDCVRHTFVSSDFTAPIDPDELTRLHHAQEGWNQVSLRASAAATAEEAFGRVAIG